MRSILMACLLALTALAPAYAEDKAAIRTDPVLQPAQAGLTALRTRLTGLRQRGDAWRGRFDQAIGLVPPPAVPKNPAHPVRPAIQPGEAAFKPISNPPALAGELKSANQRLRATAAGFKGLNLQGAAALAAADFRAALSDLEAAPSIDAAEQALDRIDAALKVIKGQ